MCRGIDDVGRMICCEEFRRDCEYQRLRGIAWKEDGRGPMRRLTLDRTVVEDSGDEHSGDEHSDEVDSGDEHSGDEYSGDEHSGEVDSAEVVSAMARLLIEDSN